MLTPTNLGQLYAAFDAPIAALDCGQKCAPYNHGVPFCCDTCHAVPTAYPAEWAYLQANTDLWHLWQAETPAETTRLQRDAGPELVLIECHGHERCQRDFRSLVCRAFPFFPYFNSRGRLLGLSYYWEYEDRCWVISNLQIVSHTYRQQFIQTYETLCEKVPGERDIFRFHSAEMRRVFRKRKRAIPLLHRNGFAYKISPASERMHRVPPGSFPKHGPYVIADALSFDDG